MKKETTQNIATSKSTCPRGRLCHITILILFLLLIGAIVCVAVKHHRYYHEKEMRTAYMHHDTEHSGSQMMSQRNHNDDDMHDSKYAITPKTMQALVEQARFELIKEAIKNNLKARYGDRYNQQATHIIDLFTLMEDTKREQTKTANQLNLQPQQRAISTETK